MIIMRCLGLLDWEGEGTAFLKNVRKHSPDDTVSVPEDMDP